MHTLENTTETEMVGIWNGTGSQGPRQRQRRCRLYSVDMNIGLDHLKLWWIILLYGFLSVVTRAVLLQVSQILQLSAPDTGFIIYSCRKQIWHH